MTYSTFVVLHINNQQLITCPCKPSKQQGNVMLLLPLLLTVILGPIVSASLSIPQSVAMTASSLPPTPVESVPSIISQVASKSTEWKELPLEHKVDLLEQVLDNTIKYQDEWVRVGCENRGIISLADPSQGCARADVVTAGPATLGCYINGLLTSLKHCSKNKDNMPPPPKRVRTVDKKTVVTLWPDSLVDKLEAVGVTGELVLDKPTPHQDSIQQACIGGVCGILGAGNFNAPIELLCEMFLHGRVCIYKPNPVNQQQFGVLRKILSPLEEAGYLQFIVGGADVGAALVSDSTLNQVVLTGSAATYEKIQPLVNKDTTICAELGGVNPWIIVPSRHWNRRSIDRHARHLAFSKLANNGHTCAAPQVVIVAKDWPYRQQFIDRLRFWLGKYAGNAPFYPGSSDMYSQFKLSPNAEVVMEGETVFEKQQRPILIPNVEVDEESSSDIFTREVFCPVLAEVPIDCDDCTDTMGFLQKAAQFVAAKCFGSLTANILIPDRDVKQNADAFDKFLVDLPFGVVGVNLWPAFAHSMPMLVWGAPPSHPQSGTGFIGNCGLYQKPQKAVLRAPFHWLGMRALSVQSPHKTEKIFRRLANYKLRPNLMTQSMLFTAIFLGI